MQKAAGSVGGDTWRGVMELETECGAHFSHRSMVRLVFNRTHARSLSPTHSEGSLMVLKSEVRGWSLSFREGV